MARLQVGSDDRAPHLSTGVGSSMRFWIDGFERGLASGGDPPLNNPVFVKTGLSFEPAGGKCSELVAKLIDRRAVAPKSINAARATATRAGKVPRVRLGTWRAFESAARVIQVVCREVDIEPAQRLRPRHPTAVHRFRIGKAGRCATSRHEDKGSLLMYMQWNDSLVTGHPKIDNEHRKLVELVNRLGEAMSNGHGKDVCGSILDELIRYTATHFATEEALMAAHRYADTATHKAQHAKLVKDVLDFQSKFRAGSVTVSVSLMKFLNDWLVQHIKGSDKALAKALKAASAASAAH